MVPCASFSLPVRSPARGTIPRTSRTSFTSLVPVLPMSSYEFYPLDGWHNFIGKRWVEVTFNYAWGMYNPPFFWSLPCVLPTDHPVWIFEFLNLQGHRKQYNLSCWFSQYPPEKWCPVPQEWPQEWSVFPVLKWLGSPRLTRFLILESPLALASTRWASRFLGGWSVCLLWPNQAWPAHKMTLARKQLQSEK